ELDGKGGTHTVAVGVVAHADGAPLEDRPAQLSSYFFEVGTEFLEGGPLDQRFDAVRFGTFVQSDFETALDAFGGLVG
ncbi:hypothetical protein, partial [Idiomarina sp. HP20-50]|uniref:hypothetical protein n=1 Tax=Idiomarina sp. HP20-50 TaxID=3070813 RepID=UPI00294AC513